MDVEQIPCDGLAQRAAEMLYSLVPLTSLELDGSALPLGICQTITQMEEIGRGKLPLQEET